MSAAMLVAVVDDGDGDGVGWRELSVIAVLMINMTMSDTGNGCVSMAVGR